MKKNYLLLLFVFLTTTPIFSLASQLQDDLVVKIAYISVPDSEADTKILEKLNGVSDFDVTIKDADYSYEDFDDFDLVIISPVASSGANGVISALDKDTPVLLLKPFALKTGGWGWGTANNTSEANMNILMSEHPIFTGLTFTDNLFTIYNEVNNNGVSAISAWTSILGEGGEIIAPPVIQIATPVSTNEYDRSKWFSIAEFEIGLEISGYTIKAPILMIGLSEFSTAYLTDEATQLISNSCYYLTGQEIALPNSISSVTANQFKIIQSDDQLKIDTAETIMKLEIIGLGGKLVSSTNTSSIYTANLSNGVYLLRVTTGNNKVFVQKFVK